MKKKKAILNFAGIIFVCLVLLVFSFIQFPIPDSAKSFKGFIGAINTGIEYKSGAKLTFKVKNNDSEAKSLTDGVEAHALRIKDLLGSDYNVEVYTVGGANIVIELQNEYSGEEISDLINVKDYSFSICNSSEETRTSYITSENIVNATTFQSGTSSYGITINFTDSGKEKFVDLLKEITQSGTQEGNAFVYVGNNLTPTRVGFEKTSYDQYLRYGSNSMSFNYSSSQESASIYAAKINSTKYNFDFEETNRIVITKEQATRNIVFTAIVLGVIILLTMSSLVVRFKMLGLVNALGLLLGLLLQIVMLQAVPVMKLTGTALVGSVVIYIIGFAMTYYLLSKCGKEYAVGKNIRSSLKFGFEKSYKVMLEVFGSLLVSGIVFYIFGNTIIRYFALGIIIGSIIYAITSIALAKWVNTLYCNINPSKAKKYGFNREEGVNELEEI